MAWRSLFAKKTGIDDELILRLEDAGSHLQDLPKELRNRFIKAIRLRKTWTIFPDSQKPTRFRHPTTFGRSYVRRYGHTKINLDYSFSILLLLPVLYALMITVLPDYLLITMTSLVTALSLFFGRHLKEHGAITIISRLRKTPYLKMHPSLLPALGAIELWKRNGGRVGDGQSRGAGTLSSDPVAVPHVVSHELEKK